MARKATVNDYKHYMGDVNLEYGGFFVNLDDWHHGYADVVRVTDLDSGCGYDGAVLIERVTVYIPTTRQEAQRVYSVCGWEGGNLPGDTAEARKMAIIDACLAYGKYDPDDYHTVIQCDPHGPMEFGGWKADYKFRNSRQSLLRHLENNGYLRDMD